MILVLAAGCDKKGKDPVNTFDREAMLRNYADNLIAPAFGSVQSKLGNLKVVADGFNIVLSTEVLEVLQAGWASAYTEWQYANAYNFGPAGEVGLRKGLIEEAGTFPTSESKIESVIAAGAWNLNDFDRDARGFLAIEYLIFGKNQSKDEIVAAFANSASRRAYLSALIQNLHDRVTEVKTAWNGSYSAQFIQNDGTDVGSSTAQLYNEFVRSYESIKNFKLGLPLGKRPGQTQAEPQLVEAYYSGHTLTVLKAHVAAIEDIWLGRSRSGQDGIGFRDYLDAVEGGKDLIVSTEAQLSTLKAALANVPESPTVSEQILGDKAFLEALYVECSKMTRFFKSDMSSL
ncbi:MAG: imelysin family protein, partial [Saprospiraceae bacterium]|nr:imelysin family protein [Saprospiraceae bacterium]